MSVTVKKLIEALKKFPDNTLVYTVEATRSGLTLVTPEGQAPDGSESFTTGFIDVPSIGDEEYDAEGGSDV